MKFLELCGKLEMDLFNLTKPYSNKPSRLFFKVFANISGKQLLKFTLSVTYPTFDGNRTHGHLAIANGSSTIANTLSAIAANGFKKSTYESCVSQREKVGGLYPLSLRHLRRDFVDSGGGFAGRSSRRCFGGGLCTPRLSSIRFFGGGFHTCPEFVPSLPQDCL